MEKAEFIEKAGAAGADQEFIDWAIKFHEEDGGEGFHMPYEIILDEYQATKKTYVS